MDIIEKLNDWTLFIYIISYLDYFSGGLKKVKLGKPMC